MIKLAADYVWHVRGVPASHLGPPNGNFGPGLGAGSAYGQLTYCGILMDVNFVPGFAPGPDGAWVDVCETCHRNFRR